MIQQIKPTLLDQIWTGESHHLSDSILVSPVVALGLALLTHGFRIMGTADAFPDSIGQEICTGRTQENPVVDERDNLLEGNRKRHFFTFPVFLPTEGVNKSDEKLDVLFLFLGELHMQPTD
jgi:hypothetical protein